MKKANVNVNMSITRVFRGTFEKIVYYHPQWTKDDLEFALTRLWWYPNLKEYVAERLPVGFFFDYGDSEYILNFYAIVTGDKNGTGFRIDCYSDEDYDISRPCLLKRIHLTLFGGNEAYKFAKKCLALTYHSAVIIIQYWWKCKRRQLAIKKIANNPIMKKYIAKTLDTLWKPGGKYCEEGYKECVKVLDLKEKK